jgi:poly(3-hydroxybutyrate) depolymerase
LTRRQRITIYLALILVGLVFLVVRWLTGPGPYRHTLAHQPEQEYYLYAPRAYTTERIWPLFVFVHGAGSDGASCFETLKKYADPEGFILLCPTFKGNTFRTLAAGEDRALIDIVAEVAGKYRLADRFFLGGFSAGAQFTHRFAFRYPALLCGAAAHSAGSYDPPPDQARDVPFVVTVGELDTSRLELGRWFSDELARNGYQVTFTVISNAGHQFAQEAIDRTLILFRDKCLVR